VGLTLAEDGTVHSIEDANKLEGYENGSGGELAQELFMQSDVHQGGEQAKEDLDLQQEHPELSGDYVSGRHKATGSGGLNLDLVFQMDASAVHEDQAEEEPEPAPPEPRPLPQVQTPSRAQTTTVPASSIQVGPDQQQVTASPPRFDRDGVSHAGFL
jgi:hypothetical protein